MEMMWNLNDWEVGEYEELLQMLSCVQVTIISDLLVQKPKQDGQLTVKYFYDVLMDSNDNKVSVFPYKQIWKAHAPLRIAFFAWKAGSECTFDQ